MEGSSENMSKEQYPENEVIPNKLVKASIRVYVEVDLSRKI